MPGPATPPIIISGGQTGADWAALDWAIRRGVPHDGWCPLGRRTEAGTIDSRFALRETPRPEVAVRTLWNVRDSDATLLLTRSPHLRGGTLWTLVCARRLQRPLLHLHAMTSQPGALLRSFVRDHAVSRLNVAGPRTSDEPGIEPFVARVLDLAFQGNRT